MKDILFIAMEDWDDVWRRNQPVAAGLAARPGRRVLFVGLAVDVSHRLRKARVRHLWRDVRRAGRFVNPPGLPNISVMKPVKWLPNTLGPCRAVNRWHERRQLRKAMRRLDFGPPVLWMNPYYSVHLPGRMNESLSVYDVGDDWTSFTASTDRERRQIVREDDGLTARADVVIVVSEKLAAMKRAAAGVMHHIPNGVYVERYAGVAEGSIPPHPMADGWPRPVLGYTGTVHADRVDLDLVVRLARAFPGGTVALVGPVMLPDADRRRLEAEPNVRLPGPAKFEEMPAVLAAFDACVVPHRVTPFTNSLSPLKLYEYLASGRPTVSTPVSGFCDHPESVYLAGAEGFVEAVKAALIEPPGAPAARVAVAAEHSWAARLADIERAVAEFEAEAEAQPEAGASA